ncbi:MAG TPA: ABC transporter substrate-binding protein [candidate division Zixibacteria bacterium]|nr:ABC transporter substrate-binding protein [candidate division Zixibacteria bacterium]
MGLQDEGVSRRKFLKWSAGAGAAALAGAIPGARVFAASKDRLTILSSIGLDSLNPYAISASPHYGIWQHMIEPLVEVNYARKEYYGVLAESWEFQGKKWVFRLRKGVRFHDGSPFTAKDVVYSVHRIRTDKRSLQASNFADVTEVQAPDDHTVVFTTREPSAVLLDRLYNRFMISKAAADKYGDQADQHPIGTGPYKFVSWQRDGNLVLTRNEDYWGRKPDIKEIVLRRVKEDAGRVAGLLAGQGDVINNVPVEELSRLENHPRVRAEKVEGLRMYFLAMNVTHKPFDNKAVRQAFNYAVDPSAIIKHVYEGNGYVMNGPLGANVIGYDPKIRRYPHDPKKARELLAAAGYGSGLEVKLYFSPDRYPKAREVCQVIADQLGKAGVKVELVSQEFVIFWGKEGVNGGKLPFYYVGRPAIDADTVFDQYYRSGVTRRVQYKNPEFDRLIDEEQKTGDPKKRVALLQQAGRILMEDVPLVPLYTLAEIYGVARNVVWRPRPDEKVLAADMRIRA